MLNDCEPQASGKKRYVRHLNRDLLSFARPVVTAKLIIMKRKRVRWEVAFDRCSFVVEMERVKNATIGTATMIRLETGFFGFYRFRCAARVWFS
jgi:hypothetical protein